MRFARMMTVLGALLLAAFESRALNAQYAFRIAFTNKSGTADLANPLSFLSQRALDRRAMFGIAPDSTDLPVSPAYIDSVLTITGGKLHVTSRWFNQCVILLEDTSAMPLLQGKPYIAGTTLVAYFPAGLHDRHAPPGSEETKVAAAGLARQAAKTTGSATYYGLSWTQTDLVHGDALHDAGYNGQGKLIAVLDAGFQDYFVHDGLDSLRQSGRMIDHWNFVYDTSYVADFNVHGMASLSTMAGYIPGTYVGSAPLAQYALYMTEDNSTESPYEMDNLVAGAERADSLGADVISCSLGYNTFGNPAFSLTHSDLDGKTVLATRGADMATTKGILWVNSAGNEGGNSWNYILTPADADSALTIGAVDASKNIWFNSSPGPNAAGQIKPDVCVLGNSATVFVTGNQIVPSPGTSFAAPQAAGYAACLLQAAPGATPAQLRQAINASADHYTNPGDQIGYGVPDFSIALQSLAVAAHSLPANGPQLWPNPFSSRLFVRVPDSTPASWQLTICNAQGAVVWRASVNASNAAAVELALPVGLPAGIYFLQGKSGKGAFVRKVVRG